ncbi:MAG: phosphodiester glycosidase family protein [Spirochaetaceae bacterium]|nr:phosphodiester glycosidase family protein [Spirochaetaceae bacterium]
MKLFLSICITILFSNCVVLSPAEQANASQSENSSTNEAVVSIAENQFNWEEIAEGIKHCSFFDETSHSRCNAVKINLDTPNINLIASRPVEEVTDGGTSVFKAETTKKFAQRNSAIVAVNATPFNYPSGRASKKRTIAGVYAINDKILAPRAGRYAALIFAADNNEKLTASILDTQNDFEPDSTTRFAFGGFWTLLKDGRIIMFKSQQKEPRTAAGILDNGKTLILLAIDKSGSTSKGATFNETSSILLKLGATEAIMLDGGSSSSLIINGRQISKTFPHVEVALSFGFQLKDSE